MPRANHYPEGWRAHRLKSPTPLNLKRILAERGIPQVRLAEAIRLSNGKAASETTITQILMRNIWPLKSPKAFIKPQIENALRQWNVPEDVIGTALEIDEDPDTPRVKPPSLKRAAVGSPAPFVETDENQLPETEMLSQNAKRHFQLFQDPFLDDVQGPEDVYLSAEQRYIREAMYQTARHGGFLAIVGESGAGKTVLRKDLIDRIAREGEPITIIQPRIIDKGRLTAGAICDAIINDVSEDRTKQSLEAKARQVERLLQGSSRSGNSHVLMIEEAHDLSVPTLKYLKRFWEMEDGFKRLLAIVLIGQPELKHRLNEHRNWEMREVIRRCEIAELQPLNGNLEEYLGKKLGRVGKEPATILDPDVYDALRARLTQRVRGTQQVMSLLYPLVVNNAIRKAMNAAAEFGVPKVTGEIVKGV